jgi:molybdopterin synthase catalytic subunit
MMMTQAVTVLIRDGALTAPPPEMASDSTGAVLHFRGVVRRTEQDQQIHGLDYAAYQPMAERTLEQIAREAIDRFGLLAIHVEHSKGFVPVGGCSFELIITASHRREALDAMDWFIDRLKQIVPIWKQPVFVDSSPVEAPRTRNH